MRTALEILARRRGRRARVGLLGYRSAAPFVDSRWQVFLVLAQYMHPDGPESEMLETAHALAAEPHRVGPRPWRNGKHGPSL